ncbi:hypothetical protein PB01_01375 [Psychrobacillus glaciei]|uniref:Uncharacterized protein n=1 Tax=Psychrobacillus glaciei TaxID=2283160 RepID=A0A5J6SIC3_9BACI|nr:hypothetical protein [Psychrobacillus glaciei]QFF97571.1 hypothetical protein PB01_01375 [Psychrobacillus glaciei]
MPITDSLMLICRNYLLSIGSDQTCIDEVLNIESFNRGLTIILSNVNVVRENRPTDYTSKQTHIHVTGESMEFFYESSFLERVIGNTDDENIRVELISSNLEHLNGIAEFRRNGESIPSSVVTGETLIYTSNTLKKIGHGGTQVQLSKKRLDGEAFAMLRNGLFPNDILVLLEYSDTERGYLAIGLPKFFAGSTELVNGGSTLFTRNQQSAANPEFRIRLSQVTAENIAKFNRTEMAEGITSQIEFNLSDGILIRGERTERHQEMLRVLASYLESNGFSLFEGNIDCLAVRENVDTLIFEAKTLDGTAVDEAKQVRLALGQLLYYEFLGTQQFANTTKLKIAFFETEISSFHIDLLKQNNCLVIWLNGQGELFGDSESLDFLSGLSNL